MRWATTNLMPPGLRAPHCQPRKRSPTLSAVAASVNVPAAAGPALTPAELDVVRLVSAGLANKDIATRLFISPRTVETHLSHVYARLGLASARPACSRSCAPRELTASAQSCCLSKGFDSQPVVDFELVGDGADRRTAATRIVRGYHGGFAGTASVNIRRRVTAAASASMSKAQGSAGRRTCSGLWVRSPTKTAG